MAIAVARRTAICSGHQKAEVNISVVRLIPVMAKPSPSSALHPEQIVKYDGDVFDWLIIVLSSFGQAA